MALGADCLACHQRGLEVGDVTFRLPPSRFLTRGLPAGNFGFQAEGQLGPVDFQAVWAEQKGDLSSREFRLSGVGSERGFVQEDTLVLDDADYVRGQFFFLVDPREIADYPHLDVLTLDNSAVSPFVEPGPEAIQLYRAGHTCRGSHRGGWGLEPLPPMRAAVPGKL